MATLAERIAGGMWGLLVGDAVGVPYEFHHPGRIPPLPEVELDPPSAFHRAHGGVAPGTWSDDGAQALCLLESLLERGRVDPDDLMRRLNRWYEHGHLAAGGRVFDVGIQTSLALERFRDGAPAETAGGDGERENGNGSLMRVLPLALWHRGSDAELVRDASLQSVVTHRHPRSQVCCALYCLWARRLLAGSRDAWSEAVAALRGELAPRTVPRAELDDQVAPEDPRPGTGTGYVVDCLRSARDVMARGSYETVVKEAIRLGHDTDTTACVAGGVAGVRDGVSAIPARWLDRLVDRQLAAPLIERLVALRSPPA
ncbi:MAG: ADP-ribosylglycohydrolase family protein [Acetobacteraceae bacterium]|nr:ADP-ribosylglycohydrolase family protein [Acetobacteraceae bacterium]